MRRRIIIFFFVATLLAPPASDAVVTDPAFADVTTKAIAVVWTSDAAVLDASVRVYAEPAGTTDISGTLSQRLVSSDFPPALDLGIVKVTVEGLTPNTCVYVQTGTQTAGGTDLLPAAPPFPEVCTAVASRKADVLGTPIVNDLLQHDLLSPADETTPASGTLLLLGIPGTSAHPLSAFTGEGFSEPSAVVNLNNVFAETTGESTEVAEGVAARLTELRGTLCPDAADQARERFRKVPLHEEVGEIGVRITEVEVPEACFFADTDCSGLVEEADAQRVIAVFDASLGDCRFNPDLDTVADDAIDVLDLQRVLNRLGELAP